MATPGNQALFCSGDAQALLGKDLKEILFGAGHCIFNLETPLSDVLAPIPKHGPNLAAPAAAAVGYKAIGADILGLANNHILDQGEQGLAATWQALEKNGIRYFGAGRTPAEAAEPCIFTWQGKKIGLYACAEHEFTIVSDTRAGANPYDPLNTFDHVAELKAECDFVVVLYHGGREHYRYPSPELQRVCRKMVEKGADLVLCQHSHCIGCEEKYRSSTILYGQGNFLFDSVDSPAMAEFWQTGLLVQVDSEWTVTYIPVVKHGCAVRLADAEQKKIILEQFAARSAEIQYPGAVEKLYNEFASIKLDDYLYAISSKGIFTRILNRLTGRRYYKAYIRHHYKQKHLLAIQDYIECEAHRELLLSGVDMQSRIKQTQ